MTSERHRLQAEFCKAMAHPVRLEVIERLGAGEATVHALAAAIGVGQANLSQHLSVLRARGVVRAERRGQEVVYRLAIPKVLDACAIVREILRDRDRGLIAVSPRQMPTPSRVRAP